MNKTFMLIALTILMFGIAFQGFVLAENDTEICDSNNLNLCLNLTDCEAEGVGGYWYNSVCNVNPEPVCDSNNLNLCGNATDCTDATGFWYNETCNTQAEPVCDSNNLNLCLNLTDCEAEGIDGFWYDDTCNAEAATCDSTHLFACDTETTCTEFGGIWDETGTPKCEEVPATCNADNLNLCDTKETCEAVEGGAWNNDTSVCSIEDEDEDNGDGQFASKEHQRIKFTARTGVECPTGCKCTGVVMKCPLEDGGRQMTIYTGSGKIIVKVKGVNMTTNVTLFISEDGTTLTGIFNGKEKKIKYLPDQAKIKVEEKIESEIEEEEIELDEDGVYQIKAKKKAKLFFLFSIKEGIITQVDSETGFVGKVNGPWWGFLARDNKLSQ